MDDIDNKLLAADESFKKAEQDITNFDGEMTGIRGNVSQLDVDLKQLRDASANVVQATHQRLIADESWLGNIRDEVATRLVSQAEFSKRIVAELQA